MGSNHAGWLRLISLAACFAVGACASVLDDSRSPAGHMPGPGSPPAQRDQPRISLSFEKTSLGAIVRHIGETDGGSLALMNGIEERRVEAVRLRRTKFEVAAERLAEEAGCAVQKCSEYFFLYPPGYEALTNVSLVKQLDPSYDDLRAAITFGAGTRLVTAFTWISQALGITVVADNVIAEARCGELTLEEIPIQAGLEAILKSARVVGGQVASSDEYIFFYASPERRPVSTLLNRDAPDEHQQALLNTRLDVFLPERPTEPRGFQIPAGPKRLGEVVDSLSEQLGIRVVAERDLEKLPVNPAVFNRVRVKTALDLLIWQWPVPDFGYQIIQDRIVIRRRTDG